MTSLLAWMDHSESDRKRMLEVVALFRVQDTRDELGLGGIRDAFSDRLFPGTSTIQTRPRYFLLVPWVMRRLERERIPSARAAATARRYEVQLIESLIAGGDLDGVFGRDARANLQRLPSAVYWGGLGAYWIRRFGGSIADYFRALDGTHARAQATRLRAESDELYERAEHAWDPNLPAEPEGLWESTTLRLEPAEADYLYEKVITAFPDALLSHLLRGPRMTALPNAPWEHPPPVPDHLAELLHHARLFSLVFHGAALLYNLELARTGADFGIAAHEALVDHYHDALDDWGDRMGRDHDAVATWDLPRFWVLVDEVNPRITPGTRTFVDQWINVTRSGNDRLADNPAAIELIRARERQVKRRLARLGDRRRLELWAGASGTAPMTYRWPTARRLILDVHGALADA